MVELCVVDSTSDKGENYDNPLKLIQQCHFRNAFHAQLIDMTIESHFISTPFYGDI